jgi:hypothetical protein
MARQLWATCSSNPKFIQLGDHRRCVWVDHHSSGRVAGIAERDNSADKDSRPDGTLLREHQPLSSRSTVQASDAKKNPELELAGWTVQVFGQVRRKDDPTVRSDFGHEPIAVSGITRQPVKGIGHEPSTAALPDFV